MELSEFRKEFKKQSCEEQRNTIKSMKMAIAETRSKTEKSALKQVIAWCEKYSARDEINEVFAQALGLTKEQYLSQSCSKE